MRNWQSLLVVRSGLIAGKIACRKESKFYDSITGYESIQNTSGENATLLRETRATGETGHRTDSDASEYRRENSSVYGMGTAQNVGRETERNSGRDRGRGDSDSRRDSGSSITDDSDVRYSVGRKTDKAVREMIEKENEKLREDLSQLKELLKLQGQETHGTKFTPSSVESAARYLKKNAGANGDTKALTKLLNGFYEYIATDKEEWSGNAQCFFGKPCIWRI